MAAPTYPPPQSMGEMSSSPQVYLQPVKDSCTILLTQTWNLAWWLITHRVGVFQTVGQILKTHQCRMASIYPYNQKTRPIKPQEVQKSRWWYKTPPPSENPPYSWRRNPLGDNKIHKNWSSHPTESHNPVSWHMEPTTPSLQYYIKTHYNFNPSGHINCGEWQVLQKQMGYIRPHNWRRKRSHPRITYTSRTPGHPEDQE